VSIFPCLVLALISLAADLIIFIIASATDVDISDDILMNPATPPSMFKMPGMYDPLGRFAQYSRSPVRQRY
jgi:hypothetical protein